MYCLDANVWVYYLDEDLPEHDAVAEDVAPLVASEQLFSTTVVLMEVVHYVSNHLAESEGVVRDLLGMEGLSVADLRHGDVERAAELLHEHPTSGLGGRDASILATVERNDVTELWTHDRDLLAVASDLDGVAVRDPVEPE